MHARIASIHAIGILTLAGCGSLIVSLSRAANQRAIDSSSESHRYTTDEGECHAYTDGARVAAKPGHSTIRNRQSNPHAVPEATGPHSPAKQNLYGIQLASRDRTGVSATPGSADKVVS